MTEETKAFSTGPYLSAALICERVLTERDGVNSLMRIVDKTILESEGPLPRPEAMPPIRNTFWLYLAFKSGEALGPETVKVTLTRPNGITDLNSVLEQDINFEGGVRGHNLAVQMTMDFKSPGPYWFNVTLGGILVTKIPYQVVYTHRRTPDITRN